MAYWRCLKCAHDKAAVTDALHGWKAFDVEELCTQAGLVGTAMRSFAEWDAHPQGHAVRGLPLLSIERIGAAPAPHWPARNRPLAGIKVLDLTRIIAGPVCGLTLAAHGADVMLVTSPKLPSIPPLVIDTRQAVNAYRSPRAFEALLREADVMVKGYRPGGLAGFGFGLQDAARTRPGIVYVSLCAYSHEGPWAGRRGFDSLVQTASGFNAAEAQAAGVDSPKPLPAQVLDHTTGYLLAYGAMSALLRRAAEGSSWHVRASLAQTGFWLRSLGRVDGGLRCKDPTRDEVRDCLEESASGFGRLSAVRHPATMSETPPHWACPSVPLGTHPPVWPA